MGNELLIRSHLFFDTIHTILGFSFSFIDGFGELQFASNDVYRGQWKDGIRHGTVR